MLDLEILFNILTIFKIFGESKVQVGLICLTEFRMILFYLIQVFHVSTHTV